MRIRKLLPLAVCLFALAFGDAAWGQGVPWNNLRYRCWPATEPIVLDSFTVAPLSLRLFTQDGQALDTAFYTFVSQQLVLKPGIVSDSVCATFRVWPTNLHAPLSLIDTTRVGNTPEGLIIGTYDPYRDISNAAAGQQLQYNGSFSRGLSVGNRQDLVLNSNFNLQVSGEIGDDIQVTAAITDENLPIQPEGNTRQLRDFDRIFIRLQKDDTQLTAGDYELRHPEGYFLRYFKKLEGATFQTQHEQGNSGLWQHRAGVAIARGQFRRQLVTAIEGNQGPYKLQGASGERFIIVLAGTEKVMLDGQPLQRGRDADYTIDYNQGEVTFTARRLITKDSRITVEFEYADQRFLRSLYTVDSRYQTDRWQAYINLYSQQDSKTATGDLPLSDAEKQLLQETGDQLTGIGVSTITPLETPDAQRATYRLADTLLTCNGVDTLIRRLVFDTEGSFVAAFSFVGEGRGHYVPDNSQNANERVFRWVAPHPITCAPQGSYEPQRPLVAPQLQRLLTAGGQYRLGKQGIVKAEMAFSTLDLNRFSPLDAQDDNGWAGRVDWSQQWNLTKDSTSWRVAATAWWEQVDQHFKAVNPYRSPEFLRDWSLADINGQGTTSVATERLGGTGVALRHPQRGGLQYRWDLFQRGDLYDGIRHEGALEYRHKGWELKAANSWLQSEDPVLQTRFVRPHWQVRKRFPQWGNWEWTVAGQSERNERYMTAAPDQLSAASFFFERYTATLASSDTASFQWSLSARTRLDYAPTAATFTPSTRATEGEVAGKWQASSSFSTSGNLTWRSLAVYAPELTSQEAANTLLGRVDLNAGAWKNTLRSNTTYEIGSGQEPLIEYTYLFVGAGLGQYIWLDSLYNNDGKIQPNEMEIAPFPDIADHIRVSIFTDDFIRTDNATLNQSIQLDPARIWAKSETGWQQLLSRFSIQSSLTINRKVRAFEGVQTWNPLQLSIPDSALVAVTANQRHILFFNRRSTRFDMSLAYNHQPRRVVPTTGYESRLLRATTLQARWNINEATTLRLTTASNWRESDSEFFNNKDYQLKGYSLEPALSYQPGQDYRITLAWKWLTEANRLPETTDAINRNEIRVEGNYKQWARASLQYVRVALEGDARSPVGFVLLNGLQKGRNWIWNASLTRPLGQFLQMTLTYEGRQTGEAATVHVGRAQLTALF
ncbi:MAG: hypothetical protein R2795_00540 [Saprospiraceae bacterium]